MTEQEFIKSVRKIMNDGLKLWDAPSVSLGIIKDGKVVLCEGFGLRDAEKSLPADGETLYQIGSCTKAFTAALCAVCVDKGLVSWDTPIREYAPDIRFYDDYVSNNVTLRDVLAHRTGMPRHEYSWYNAPFNRAELVHNIRFLEPNKPFRTNFQYNNYGYIVAGAVLEAVTGKTWEQLLSEYILEPLGMDHTNAYLDATEADPDHAVPYDRPEGLGMKGYVKIPYYRTPCEDLSTGTGAAFAPAGSINSCAADMLKWVQFHLQGGEWDGKQLISKEAMDELHKPNIPCSPLDMPMPEADAVFNSYAMGWKNEVYRGHRVISHGGNINGFSAYTCFVPDLQLGVVSYTNLTATYQHYAIGHTVMDYYMGASGEDWMRRYYDFVVNQTDETEAYYAKLRGEQAAGTAPSHGLKAYEGTYSRPGYSEVVIREENGKLVMDYMGSAVPLTHYHYDTFTTDIVFAGGELRPGFPVKFYTGDSSADIEVVTMPLVLEDGTFIRFSRVK